MGGEFATVCVSPVAPGWSRAWQGWQEMAGDGSATVRHITERFGQEWTLQPISPALNQQQEFPLSLSSVTNLPAGASAPC